MSLINNNNLTVDPNNVTQQFRDEFQTFDTTNSWTSSIASGDIVQIDGNSAGISYLVISKDPLTTGETTTITSKYKFTGVKEVIAGLCLSQRLLGQEFSIEYASDETPLSPIADVSISSISQITTTLTVTTATPHGFVAGARIGINGITSDSRLNYPSLVIASVPTPTTFTCISTPAGTITNITVGPYTNQGVVYYRPAINYAVEGFSQVFENATVTHSSMYVRTASGDVYPSGTFTATHAVTIGTTAPVATITAPGAYAFIPTTDYRYSISNDKLAYYDSLIDNASNQPTGRLNRTSYIPDVNKNYNLRFRFVNNKSLPIPTAKIVSASKTGTTTATFTTETNHGLTTGDLITIYGVASQTNFPNVLSAVQVLSTPTLTSFTAVQGAAVTASSYGGLVSRSQGSLTMSAFVSATAAISCTVTSSQLQLTGNVAWAGFSIGDYVNVYGVKNSSGADLGVDGAYRVFNINTSTFIAYLEPIGSTVLPSTMTAVACGGCIIKRTDARIPYVRVFDYQRQRVEVLNKNDIASAIPVVPNGGTISTVGTVTAVSSANMALNAIVADIASAALTTSTTTTAVTPSWGLSQEFSIMVTAVTGTLPTMDVVIQESDDTGTNWYDVYHFPRITTTGQYRSPLIQTTGNRIRYVQTVGGTLPSFTRSVNRLQSNSTNPLQRQFFDRSIAVNTIDSVTPSFFTEGCVDVNVLVSMGAVTTTAPVLVYEISPDNATWVQVGSDITTAASTNNLLQLSNVMGRFSRIRVKTAGTGASLNHIMIKSTGK